MRDDQPIVITCRDGIQLKGHLWPATKIKRWGHVIINPATGVLARYYHRYARFLAATGFDVLTYDYRGIGLSRPAQLRGCGYRWRDWGELDFDAALEFIQKSAPCSPILVVGHSIGGFLPGLSPRATSISRMLTVGAQYAYWRDYTPHRRWRLVLKWHVVMPVLTALFGHFPGRRLGWLEDLPAGVANEWSFRRSRIELDYPADRRQAVLDNFSAVTAPILAVAPDDDDFATIAAMRRALDYYGNAPRNVVRLAPRDLGVERIGHFDLFHARHESTFWRGTLQWLHNGVNPWSCKTMLRI